MAYLLLLALVCSASFAILVWPKPGAGRLLAAAFVLLAIGLLAQIVLVFSLSADWVRLFYFSRYMLVAACLAAAFFSTLFPKHPVVRWLPAAIFLIGFVCLALVGSTALSRAEDWFQPAKPLFAQISDLLATNRPTRWLAIGLNVAGGAVLIAGSVLFAFRRQIPVTASAALLAGTALLLAPLLFPSQEFSNSFYIQEVLIPVLFFFGFQLLRPLGLRKRVR